MKWKITYFNKKIFENIMNLPKKLKGRFLALSDSLMEKGPNLSMPHSRAMGDELFELRVKAAEGIARVFYCAYIKNEVVILHMFIKKTQKTLKKELDIARKRLKEVKENG